MAREANQRLYDELLIRHERYLRDLLARLPFRWHIAHAYTAQETGSYGGADHIGRLKRELGDALSRARKNFWGLHEAAENDRLPTSLADIKIAERIVAGLVKKTSAQIDRDIAEVLGEPPKGHR